MIKEGLWDNSKHLSPNHMAYFANHTGKDKLDNATEDTMVQNKVQAGLELGGTIALSAVTLMNWKGMASQEACPYPATAEDVPIDEEKAQLHEAITKDYLFVPTENSTIEEQVAVMKGLIQQYGAIDWSYKDVSNVEIDEADYYNEMKCAYYYDAPLANEGTNHEITVVGWDDNFSKENFGDPEATCDYDGNPAPQPEGDGAWLVKNSWGDGWGDHGYFYISYYDALMSREPAAVTKVVPRDTYDNNYFWGNTNSDCYLNIQKAAQVFRAKGATGQEELKAVSMMLDNDHVKYSIQVYKNPDMEEDENGVNVVTDPASGTPMLTEPITDETGYAGLVTVDFKEHGVTEPLIFKKGDVMSIVITFPDQVATVYADKGTSRRDEYRENEDGTKELLWSVDSTNITHPGQSFLSDTTDDGEFVDLHYSEFNLRINALTSNMEPQYTVTFRDDEGNPIGEPQTVEKGQAATPPEAPEKRGYQFTGWDGSYENITTDTVLTAQYKKIEYTITYELDGGTNNENNPATYTIIENIMDVILFEAPVRDGYAFMGWYTDIAMKEIKNLIDEGETGDLTLYAKWVEDTGDIIPPEFVPEDDIVEEGEYIAIWSNEDADIYYTTDGTDPVIDIAADGTITYKNGTRYKNPISVSEDVTVKAVAVRLSRLDKSDVVTKEYSYYNMYLSLEQEALTLAKGETGRITVTKRPTRAEETAITWTSSDEKVVTVSENGEVTAVAKGTVVITASTTNYKDETVTAECRVTVTNPIYQVTFLDYEGKQIGEVQQVEAGADALPPERSKIPVEKGYQFTGWDGSYRNIQGDTVLTAQYKATAYKITYVLDGGVNSPENPRYYTIKYGTIVLYDATKDGAAFMGWYDNPEFKGDEIYSIDAEGLKDITLYAKWYVGEGLWVEEIEDYVYTGKAVKPTGFAVYDGITRLTEGVDYTVSYKNNVNANTEECDIDDAEKKKVPLVIVKGKGNYKGTVKQTFKIRPMEIDVTIDDIAVAQKNRAQKPNPVIKWGGKTLKPNKDYKLSVENGYSEPGSYPMKAWGIGNYEFAAEFDFIITDNSKQKPISKVSLTNRIGTLEYTGQPVDSNTLSKGITLKNGRDPLVEGTDYQIEYDGSTDAGTHDVIIRGLGNYAGVRRTTFKIKGTDIKKASFGKLPDVSYNGDAQCPAVSINCDGRELTEYRDYEVIYSNNINAGTAKATITGRGQFSGTRTISFKIKPVGASKLRISFAKAAYAYEKGGVKPSPTVTYSTEDGRTLLLTEGTDYTLSYKDNTAYNPGKKPQVTVKAKKNFTGSQPAEFTIGQKDLSEIGMVLLPDVEASDRPGKFYTKPELFDTNGKKLAAGRDYDSKNIIYQDQTGKVLDQNSTPKAGDVITVTIKAAANGSYKGETENATYRIVEKSRNLARAKITVRDKNKFRYTGSDIVPQSTDIKVVLDGTELKPDDYQIVAYPNNPKKGSAKFLIAGKHEKGYGGQKTITISIGAQEMEWWK